jgi:hypothetical protein
MSKPLRFREVVASMGDRGDVHRMIRIDHIDISPRRGGANLAKETAKAVLAKENIEYRNDDLEYRDHLPVGHQLFGSSTSALTKPQAVIVMFQLMNATSEKGSFLRLN